MGQLEGVFALEHVPDDLDGGYEIGNRRMRNRIEVLCPKDHLSCGVVMDVEGQSHLFLRPFVWRRNFLRKGVEVKPLDMIGER